MNEFLETIFEIVKAAQQWDRFTQRGQHFHLKIENEPYMPLVIEAWDSPIPGEGRRISVAHYFESNGDLVPDPEVDIRDDGWPIELSQVLGYTQVTVYREDGTLLFAGGFLCNRPPEKGHRTDEILKTAEDL